MVERLLRQCPCARHCRIWGRMVIVDLSRVDEIDTATLARLVALRRRLSHVAMDLRIRGLSVRGRQLYELYRLQKALPEG